MGEVLRMPFEQEQVNEIAEQVAKEVSEKVIKQFFLTLGINTADPDAVLKLQKDFIHLRTWRESVETIKHRGLAAAVWFIVTAFLGWVVLYITKKQG